MISFDINDAVVLKALLEDPHLTRGAGKLNLTQSAISHSLKRLRLRFADPLFVRGKSGLEATSFLLSLEPLLDDLLRSSDAIRSHAQVFDPATSSQVFTIGMPELVSIPFIPRFLKNIRKSAPEIVLNFNSVNPQEAGSYLEDKKLDLYIGQPASAAQNLKSQSLYRESFVCLARKEYKIFKNHKISKNDYLDARHLKLSLQGGQQSYIDQALTGLGVSRKNTVTLPFYLLGFEIMRHEDIVMTAPLAMVTQIIQEFSMQKFFHTAPFPFAIESLPISQFWHMRSDSDTGHAWLRKMIKATGKDIADTIK